MPATRARRIVRRVVIALVGVLLLMSGYVGSGFILSFADAAGWFPDWAAPAATLVYRPLVYYLEESEYPGSDDLR
jgi:hypothetical protein